jgi:hypothetical protein
VSPAAHTRTPRPTGGDTTWTPIRLLCRLFGHNPIHPLWHIDAYRCRCGHRWVSGLFLARYPDRAPNFSKWMLGP